jgi:hypothetical protein
MLDTIDNIIGQLAESSARLLDRRQLLSRTAKGIVATIAGIALGQIIGVGEALAACTCNWAGGGSNANCPHWSYPCPIGGAGCPSGCSVCTTSSGCGTICNYSNGQWLSCNGLGSCGTGFRMCTDCACPNCSYICTCLSNCICCTPCCHSADQIRAEVKRLAALQGQFAESQVVAL